MLTISTGFLLVFAAMLEAAPPSIREIYPRGAQRGKSLTVYLRGDGLAQGSQVKTTLPGSFSKLTLSRDPLSESGAAMAKPGTVLPFLLTVKADAPTGIYPVRVLTPEGVSNVVLFTVGDLPEVEEVESKNPKQPNNFPNEAQKITVPAVISGTLENADIDQYIFSVQAGQKLVFEVEARRAGSAIDPAIEIYDSAGREIARNDDAVGLGVDSRVEVSFARAGEYRVQIHDSKFSEQAQNFYRLKIGSYAYATAVFPLGARHGETVDVTLSGGNLPQPVKVKAEAPSKGAWFPVRVPGSPSLPIYLTAGDEAETLEESTPALAEGRVVNGRIAKAGEVDRFKLSVTPGEKWVFEVTAASLGISELDGLLTLYDAAGKKLAGADDGNGPDPVLPFTVPKGVSEITVALEDLLGRGGPGFGYRLVARRQEPDFVAELLTPFVNVPAGGTAQVACLIQRRGYDGVIKLKIPDLPPGFDVAGGNIPSEAAAQNFNNDNAGRRTARSVLTITAPAGATALYRELTVIAEAHTPNGVMRRTARAPGLIVGVRGDRQRSFTAPWLEMPLALATAAPIPVTLELGMPAARFSQGFEYVLTYQVKRREGARVAGRVNNQIAGAVGNLRILKGEAGRNPDAGSYLVNTNFATPLTTFDMVLEVQAELDGKTVNVTSPIIEIQVVPGYEVQLAQTEWRTRPGGTFEIDGKVRREPTFEGGLIRIRAEDLPDGVRCDSVEVPADQKPFSMRCQAGSTAQAGSFEFRIASAAPDTGRKAKDEYKIADLNGKLRIEPVSGGGAQ